MSSLSGKVVIITGAGSGIGSATACELARQGASLALVGRRMETLRDTVRLCREAGLDSTQVNNAGVAIFSDIFSSKMSEWDLMMTINVRTPFLLTKLCLPHLIHSKGSVVNVSTVQAQTTMPQCIAYSMGKAALDHFSRTLAAGFVATEIHVKSGMKTEVYKEYKDLQKALTPLGRCPSPQDVASVIAFLASDHAALITGETIRVDGGRGVAAPCLTELSSAGIE
ncbi:hypothetical protein ACOMHN_005515 [Nucella lapillus]